MELQVQPVIAIYRQGSCTLLVQFVFFPVSGVEYWNQSGEILEISTALAMHYAVILGTPCSSVISDYPTNILLIHQCFSSLFLTLKILEKYFKREILVGFTLEKTNFSKIFPISLSRKGETSPEKKKTLLSTPMIMHG